MENISKELWEILELVRSGELNQISLNYLKNAFGIFFAKYLYNKDLTYLKFIQILENDLKNERIDIINLLENLSKIYYLHRDLKTALKLKELEIKEMEKSSSNELNKAYYSVANIYFEDGQLKKALEYVQKAINSINKSKLGINELKLFLDSLIMQNQLKQELKFPTDEILKDIKYIQNLFDNTSKYFEEDDVDKYFILINYLYLSNFVLYGNYEIAIKYGEKIIELIENKNVKLKFSLRYRIYENLAMAYLFEKRYKEAIKFAKKAINIKNSLLTISTFSALSILAEAYYALKDYDEALSYALEANSYVSNSISKLTYLYEILTKIYASKGDEKKAREYLMKLRQLKDILQKEKMMVT